MKTTKYKTIQPIQGMELQKFWYEVAKALEEDKTFQINILFSEEPLLNHYVVWS